MCFLLSFVLFFGFSLPSHSQTFLSTSKKITQYSQHTWQKRDGLPQNSITSITQSDDGYMWIGTHNGLVKFDGREFKVFSAPTDFKNNTQDGISDNFVSVVQNTKQSGLWVGTNGEGISNYNFLTFKNFNTQKDLIDNTILCLEEWKDNIWIGTPKGLSRYRRSVFRNYTQKDGLLNVKINTLLKDTKNGQNTLWIGTDEGLAKFNLDLGKITPISLPLPDVQILALESDVKNNLYIGTANGLFYWNIEKKELRNFNDKKNESNNYELIRNATINTLLIDKLGSVWIGTNSQGLLRYIPNLEKFEALTTKEGLASNSITALFEDKEGSLWVGMNRGGFLRLNDSKFTSYSTLEGLSDNLTNCIFTYSDKNQAQNQIWIGTQSDGISIFNQNYTFSYLTIKNGLPHNHVRSITATKNANNEAIFWIGTYGGGMAKYNSQTKKITVFDTKNGLVGDFVRAIQVSKINPNKIIILTTEGLSILDENKVGANKFTNYTTSQGLASNNLTCVLETQNGQILVGTEDNGILLIENPYSTNNTPPSFFSFTTQDGLADNLVLSLYQDLLDNTIYIGTKNGISTYNNGKIITPKSTSQWSSDAIHSILKVSSMWWFTSNDGVWTVSNDNFRNWIAQKTDSLNITSYDENDGLRSSDCASLSYPSITTDQTGNIWIPTTQGFSSFNYTILHSLLPKPNVIIEGVFDENGNNWSLKETDNNEKVVFPSEFNNVEIHFDALTFVSPQKVMYKYKLEGYDKEWRFTDKRTVFYGDLLPKEYIFQVKAANSDGVWNEEGTSFSFKIKPKFTQVIWFWLVLVALILIIAFIIYKWQAGIIENQHKKLEELVESRTEALFIQTTETQNQASELAVIDKIVASVNKQVTFEDVLHTLLEQALTLVKDTNKGYFLYYQEDYFHVAVPQGYTHHLPEKLSFDKVINYFKWGVPLARYFYKVYPTEREYLLAPYTPRFSLVIPILIENFPEAILVFDFEKERSFSLTESRQLQRFTEHAISSFLKARAYKEVQLQKEALQDTVGHLSDSIQYAFKIQQAILTNPIEIKSHFEDAFVFYRPRDVVSGDFYWFYENKETGVLTFAVIDCTGHGVPGAFMTVMTNSILNQIIRESHVENPAEILTLLDKKLEETFSNESKRKDGMDIGIFSIDKSKKILNYAAAKLDLCFIRDNEIHQIKATRYPIGNMGTKKVQEKSFQTHAINYQKGDIFYLYTDGFPDQFGGEENRKFMSRRFREFLLEYHYLSAVEQEEKLGTALEMWKGNIKQTDDILVVGVKVE
ncbi:Y_Y_Y domain-containing protein,putative transcriptional regulator [Bernardetia litoralis DSM 6794]|uniref:Y_Y_Y domain-containing protein,putative transcriptional regulator n=1 Tax=Bernardetia litoralis (strain ATCC 23117 / DSM 6794 / NBRC 15988 / NCIMB 1366 / Fx l1 / Sio-4) TaxID=880071 RepID=I4AG05_BERLS|nr:Y_Y_Y domain-containing protein,putative transcriptional regulator [Bernardetia litoralis DSM 6794]